MKPTPGVLTVLLSTFQCILQYFLWSAIVIIEKRSSGFIARNGFCGGLCALHKFQQVSDAKSTKGLAMQSRSRDSQTLDWLERRDGETLLACLLLPAHHPFHSSIHQTTLATLTAAPRPMHTRHRSISHTTSHPSILPSVAQTRVLPLLRSWALVPGFARID
jgi:hypothetical protein